MAFDTQSKRLLPKWEERMSEHRSSPSGKKWLTGTSSPVFNGLGFGIGAVRKVIDPISGEPRSNNRSKERTLQDATGSVRKFDMDILKSHASTETPVAFPGWRNYPPTYSPTGQKIDYMLSSHGGSIAERQIGDSRHAKADAFVAGNTNVFVRQRNPMYQTDIIHMGSRYDPLKMGEVRSYDASCTHAFLCAVEVSPASQTRLCIGHHLGPQMINLCSYQSASTE